MPTYMAIYRHPIVKRLRHITSGKHLWSTAQAHTHTHTHTLTQNDSVNLLQVSFRKAGGQRDIPCLSKVKKIKHPKSVPVIANPDTLCQLFKLQF